MNNQKEIAEELDFMHTLRGLCLSYEEISVTHMQQIKNLVIATRSFYNRLAQVYYDVKSSYQDRVIKLEKRSSLRASPPTDQKNIIKTLIQFIQLENKTTDTLTKKDEKLAVLISSNTKLHGSITDNVFRLFADSITRKNTDVMIIGRLGRNFYKSLPPPAGGKNYLYFEVPDISFKLSDLKAIVYHLQQYKNITVYFGQYQSMLHQIPKSASVTGDESLDVEKIKAKPKVKTKSSNYLFEPSLEQILHFFETQIFSALFKQTMHESQLARFASRVQAMEIAINNIDNQQKKLFYKKRRNHILLNDKKQLQRISGISLWRKRL